jgi:outer membrane protein
MKKALRAFIVILSIGIIAFAAVTYMRTSRATAETGDLIGFVDSDEIVEKYAPAKDANAAWDTFQKQQDEILRQKIIEKYKTDDVASLPQEAQLEVQKMANEADEAAKAQFEKIRQQQWEPAKEKIQSAIDAAAKEKGVRVVLDKKVVLSGGVDLTADAIANLNK